MELYDELVARGLIAQVTNEEEIKKLINAGKAVFYIGFDPTADSLHVGHFMALCLMKRLQMAGNKPIALIGGGTAMIGDPSGRTDMRQMMTKETIEHNCECFKKQMSRFIDFSDDKALMVNNADWLLDLNYIEFIRDVGSHFSVNRMLSAECYKQRMEKGLSFLEFNYMIMQSYDFMALYEKYGCNLEFGGDDQWSNMLGGTELIRRKLGKDAHAMTINLLLNSEGKKMEIFLEKDGSLILKPYKTEPDIIEKVTEYINELDTEITRITNDLLKKNNSDDNAKLKARLDAIVDIKNYLKRIRRFAMSRKEEILEVKKLGERIGYGNLMDIASALMSIKSDGIEIGHVPTVLPCIKKEERADIEQQVFQRVAEIRTYGIN